MSGVVLERLSHYYTVGHGDTRLRSPAMIIVFEKKKGRRKVFYSETTTNSISMVCVWQIDLYKK